MTIFLYVFLYLVMGVLVAAYNVRKDIRIDSDTYGLAISALVCWPSFVLFWLVKSFVEYTIFPLARFMGRRF